MGTLYLVRHGQASFGAADYDQLSELGTRQCLQLGRYFKDKAVRFDTVLVGTLRRQQQSLQAITDGLGEMPVARVWPGLDEYDSQAVLRTVLDEALPQPDTPERYRHHFRLLRQGLLRWIDGSAAPAGMPSYVDFVAGVVGALEHVRAASDGHALIVSSGGPIATAVGHVLDLSPAMTIELNLRIRNSALTEFAWTPKRHMLLSYNHLPHLDHPERADWVTYS